MLDNYKLLTSITHLDILLCGLEKLSTNPYDTETLFYNVEPQLESTLESLSKLRGFPVVKEYIQYFKQNKNNLVFHTEQFVQTYIERVEQLRGILNEYKR